VILTKVYDCSVSWHVGSGLAGTGIVIFWVDFFPSAIMFCLIPLDLKQLMFGHLLNDLHTIQLDAGGQVSLLRPAIWVSFFCV